MQRREKRAAVDLTYVKSVLVSGFESNELSVGALPSFLAHMRSCSRHFRYQSSCLSWPTLDMLFWLDVGETYLPFSQWIAIAGP